MDIDDWVVVFKKRCGTRVPLVDPRRSFAMLQDAFGIEVAHRIVNVIDSYSPDLWLMTRRLGSMLGSRQDERIRAALTIYILQEEQ